MKKITVFILSCLFLQVSQAKVHECHGTFELLNTTVEPNLYRFVLSVDTDKREVLMKRHDFEYSTQGAKNTLSVEPLPIRMVGFEAAYVDFNMTVGDHPATTNPRKDVLILEYRMSLQGRDANIISPKDWGHSLTVEIQPSTSDVITYARKFKSNGKLYTSELLPKIEVICKN